MTSCLLEELRAVQHRAAFRVFGGKDQPVDARKADGARAHGAGFQRDAQRHSDQPLVSEQIRGSLYNNHLGMRGRIVPLDDSVAIAGENLTIGTGDDGPDRNLSPLAGLGGLIEGDGHQFVICHLGRLP